MKILVREYDNNNVCNYVWKKIRDVNPISGYGNTYYSTDDGNKYAPYVIMKISHDYRKSNYVICKNCGKVIKKGREVAHYEASETGANCMKCDKLRLRNISDIKPEHKLLPDGRVISKTIQNPYCDNCGGWSGKKLSEVNKVSECKYFECRRNGTTVIKEDFLSTYPNPYNDFPTERRAIECGWHVINKSDRYIQYANKSGKVIAYFDNNGILMYYELLKRKDTFGFTYSDVYDKFMYEYGSEFDWADLSEVTKNRYIRDIKKLYE